MASLKVLYIGDIMGSPGRAVVKRLLPGLRQELGLDLVIAQSENVSHGKGMNLNHFNDLKKSGVDVFSGGNHSAEKRVLIPILKDPQQPVLAPLNQPGMEESWGAKVVKTTMGDILVGSLVGTTFPRSENQPRNPLLAMDKLLESVKDQHFIAKIFNFHGDFSSEKRVIGYYLDGKVSAVIGDHWHIPTADAMILPRGTAHVTDVGMCGTLHSSLGVATEIIISRWRDGTTTKNEIAEDGPYQFNAVLVTIDTKTGKAQKIKSIQKVLENLD